MRAKAISICFVALILTAAASGQNVAEVARMKHKGGIHAIAFSPDGNYMATGSFDGSARVWEVPSGREVARMIPNVVEARGGIDLHDSYGLAFSPNGRYLAAGNRDGTTRVWEAASGKFAARMASAYREALPGWFIPYQFAFSPDGKHLATGSADGIVRVWEVPAGREISRMKHEEEVLKIAFSPDGKYLATGSGDTARVWELAAAQEVSHMRLEGRISQIAFSPDGRYLAAVNHGPTARLWEAVTGREVALMRVESATVWKIAFSRDGRYLATGGYGVAQVWESANGRRVSQMTHKGAMEWRSKSDGISTMAFSPDGLYLATAWWDGPARVYEAASGREVARLSHGVMGVVLVAVFSPDGRYLATAGGDTVKLWLWRPPGPDSGKAETLLPGSQDTTPAPGIPPPQPTREAKLPEIQVPPAINADEFEMSGARQAILSAKTVSVVGEMGSVESGPQSDPPQWWPDPDPASAKKMVEKVIQKWGRFTLTEDPAQADLVLIIREGRREETSNYCYSEWDTNPIFVDWLRVVKGGGAPKPDAPVLWHSGNIEDRICSSGGLIPLLFSRQKQHVEARVNFSVRSKAAKKFRKFVEALEKERGK